MKRMVLLFSSLFLLSIMALFTFQNCSKFKPSLTETHSSSTATNDSSITTASYFNSQSESGLYAYAPSIIDINGELLFFTCHSHHDNQPYYIQDDIYVHTQGNEKMVIGNERVLDTRRTDLRWDDYNLCDPSVVQGNFKYNGTSYKYAMFYTGAGLHNYKGLNNQVGLAVSNDLERGWIRYPHPIIPFSAGHGSPEQNKYWGFGQPSAVKLSAEKILLIFSAGEPDIAGEHRTTVDLSNFTDTQKPPVTQYERLNPAGLQSVIGADQYFTDVDIAFNPTSREFYAIRSKHYNQTNNQSAYPIKVDWSGAGLLVDGYLAPRVEILKISEADFWNNGAWTAVTDIGKDQTGNFLNHNPGLAKTLDGYLPNPSQISAYFSSACKTDPCSRDDYFYNFSILSKNIPIASTPPPEPQPQPLPTPVPEPTPLPIASSNYIINWQPFNNSTYFIDISEDSNFSRFWNYSTSSTQISWLDFANNQYGGYPNGQVGRLPNMPVKEKIYYYRVVVSGSEIMRGTLKLNSSNVFTKIETPLFLLTWTVDSSATRYLIDISQDSNFTWFWNCQVTGAMKSSVAWSSCQNQGLSGSGVTSEIGPMPVNPVIGVTYYYRVVSFNGEQYGQVVKTGTFKR
jgi:predicted heme/steroid binding protein